MLAVETLNLTKDYRYGFWRKRPRRALDSLNLSIEAGEAFGLLGPNGAGKSTTLKLLLRLIFPTSGSARVLGCSLGDLSARLRVGYLPENPSFYDHLTGAELLKFTAQLFGQDQREAAERTQRLLERAGLSGSSDVPIRKYSKGMVQRLGIAQALINDPDLIILDEPMSGLDPAGRREVRNLILELRRQGKTVVFSTHILSDAETLCDRVAILNGGRLTGCGDLREVLSMEFSATEMVLENPSGQVLRELNHYARSMFKTGDLVRIEFDSGHDSNTMLGMALACGARVVSLNPVKCSLEDYFFAQVREQEPAVQRSEQPAPTNDPSHSHDRIAHL